GARLVGSACEGPRNVVDVPAAALVIDHGSGCERIREQRQVDHRVELVAGVAVGGGGVTRVDVRLSHIQFRLVGDVTHHAGLGTGAEQGALRAFQNLDALHVGGV